MRVICLLILGTACLIPQTGYAQNSKPSFSSEAQVKEAAEKAWKPFFIAFREAVKKRDRDALKKMMPPYFTYYMGGRPPDSANDARDQAFNYWDKTSVLGWSAFDRALSRGTAPATADLTFSSYGVIITTTSIIPMPTRVAPAAALNESELQSGRIGWWASFEFHKDGRWYCWAFVEW
jgi:hypothetical protein